MHVGLHIRKSIGPIRTVLASLHVTPKFACYLQADTFTSRHVWDGTYAYLSAIYRPYWLGLSTVLSGHAMVSHVSYTVPRAIGFSLV